MILGIVRAIAVLLFMYLAWRNLRDNYKEEDLIKFLWLSIIFYLVGGRIGYGLINWGIWNDNIIDWLLFWKNPGIDYLVGSIVLIVVEIILSIKNNWKVMQVLEDIIGYIFLFNGVLFLDEFIRSKWELKSGLIVSVLILSGLLGFLIKKKYRSMSWYRSGKKGFVFYFNVILFSLSLGLISFFLKENIVFWVVYFSVALISLIGLLVLGGVFEPLFVGIRRRKNNG